MQSSLRRELIFTHPNHIQTSSICPKHPQFVLNRAKIRAFEAIILPFELRIIGFLGGGRRSMEERQRGPDYGVEEA